jgi:glycosyltransferase involved in cell wall biosynthesis
MLLSIGMIVKNEEKYLRRVLEAMKPILEQLDSELIIADTGSTDETVNIAKEFTDKVFSYKWCNDFSAARNSTLKRARGAWFMAVDGDEVFEDASPLIEFFKSGEYKKYNSATFVQRNYSDKELKNSTDFNAPRLTKLTKSTCYVNAIHERLTTFSEPIKILPLIAGHFGYITRNNVEFVKQKGERNLELLFPQLEADPKDYFCLYNICQSYWLMDDYDNALKYCDEALKYAKEQNKFIQYSIYCSMAGIYFQMGKTEQTRIAVDDFFNSKTKDTGILATDLEMYYFKAECCFKQSKYEESITPYKEYLKLFHEYRRGLHRTLDTMHHSINFIDDSSLRHAIFNLIHSYIYINEYDAAINETAAVFSLLAAESSSRPNKTRLSDESNGLSEIYKNTEETHLELFQNILEDLINIEKCRPVILKEFYSVGISETSYSRFMKLRYEFDESSLSAESVQSFLEESGDLNPIYADAIYFALYAGVPVQILAQKLDTFDLGKNLFCSPYLHAKDLAEVIFGLYERSLDKPEECDANVNLWLSSLYLWALTSQNLQEAHVEALFSAYGKASFAYLSEVFKANILSEENAALIPKPLRTGFYCYLAADSLEKGQTAQYLKYLKTALNIEHGLKNSVALLRDRLQKKLELENANRSKFEMYAISVKNNISLFIAKGDTANALKIINSYDEICPGDPDIAALRTKIISVIK